MTDNEIEKIEAFLQGKMEPEDKKNFERELATNTELFDALNSYVAIETIMANKKEYTDESTLKSTLAHLGTEFFATTTTNNLSENKKPSAALSDTSPQISTSPTPRVGNIQIWKLVAAIFFGVIIMGTLYLVMNKKSGKEQQLVEIPKAANDTVAMNKKSIDTAAQIAVSPNLMIHDSLNHKPQKELTSKEQQSLFAAYFVPDATPVDKEGPLQDAFEQYDHKKYTNAAAAFEDAEPDLDTRGEETDSQLTKFYASYYKALSYMAIGKDDKAIRQLKNTSPPDPLSKAKVQWYLALAYIRTGRMQDAEPLLQALNKNGGAAKYRTEANELMNKLKSGQ